MDKETSFVNATTKNGCNFNKNRYNRRRENERQSVYEKAETCPASAAKLSRVEIKNDGLLRFCEGKGTIEDI